MPGPPSPGTEGATHKLTSTPKHTPPKVSGISSSEIVSEATAGATSAPEYTNQIRGPWVVLTTAIGVSGPAHITEFKTTLQALRRYGG